jgi:U3 small nucleolar ribonucleoprotein component
MGPTEESTSALEDVIRNRIIEESWDDPERKEEVCITL